MHTTRPNKISIRVRLYRSKTYSDGKHPVRIFLSQKGVRRSINTGIALKASEWNDKKNEVRSQVKKRNAYQKIITQTVNNIESVILKHEMQGKSLSLATLVDQISPNKTSSESVNDFFNRKIEWLNENNKIGSLRTYKYTRNTLFKFTKQRTILFEDITPSFVNSFDAFLSKKGISSASKGIILRNLRALYNSAIKKGIALEDEYPFKKLDFSIPSTALPAERKFLNKEEMDLIKKADVTNIENPTELALIVFKLIYLSGGTNFRDLCLLRHKDLANISIRYIRRKTTKEINYKLREDALELLQLFIKGSPNPNEYILPFLSRKRHTTEKKIDNRIRKCLLGINRELKYWQVKLDIPIKLTTYVARHSFASAAYRGGVNIKELQQVFAHSSIATTARYVGQFDTGEVSDFANSVI